MVIYVLEYCFKSQHINTMNQVGPPNQKAKHRAFKWKPRNKDVVFPSQNANHKLTRTRSRDIQAVDFVVTSSQRAKHQLAKTIFRDIQAVESVVPPSQKAKHKMTKTKSRYLQVGKHVLTTSQHTKLKLKPRALQFTDSCGQPKRKI